MTRYIIELAYNGTRFCGWQIQPNAPSIQQEISENLGKVLRHKVDLVGAGRTDTGVHASYYVAHFDTEVELGDLNFFVLKLNRMLSKDISIFSMQKAPSDFHARFSAVSRTYNYFVNTRKDPFARETSWFFAQDLDLQAMNVAAKSLFKFTDFTSFSKLHTQVKTNNCKILSAFWTANRNGLVFEISADRFLRNMVRAIVGTMVQVGLGKMSVEKFEGIIEQRDRSLAGTSAKPEGLFLVDVKYPEGVFMPCRR